LGEEKGRGEKLAARFRPQIRFFQASTIKGRRTNVGNGGTLIVVFPA